jgi:hypothetical protein
MGIRKAMGNVLRHPRAEEFLDLAIFQPRSQLFDCGDAELLVNAHDTLRIKTRILADLKENRVHIGAELFKLAKRPSRDDLADCAGNRAADSRKLRQVLVATNHLIEALR